jgi:hypothetical protein
MVAYTLFVIMWAMVAGIALQATFWILPNL